MVEGEDLRRLMTEFNELLGDPDEPGEAVRRWAEKSGISEQALLEFSEVVIRGFGEMAPQLEEAGVSPYTVFQSVIMACFSIGWEAGKEYGNRAIQRP